MMRNLYNIIKVLSVALLFGLSSCAEGVVEEGVECLQLNYNESEHTLIMYLMADNNLSNDIYRNAIDAERGMVGALPSTRLIIYLDKADKTELYEVRYMPYGSGDEHIRTCEVLKTYPRQTSTNPVVMMEVLEDIKRLAPSRSYGLVMAGHGAGWFPSPSSGTTYNDQKVAPLSGVLSTAGGEKSAEFYFPQPFVEQPKTRYMGYDHELDEDGKKVQKYIETTDIVKGLSPIYFDYIIFDACFMSSIEFLYAMRYSTDYIIASPAEILACGLPYREIVANLMSVNHDVRSIAEIAMDVYMRDDLFTNEKSLAISVVDCSKLSALSDVMADIYDATGGTDHLQVLQERVDVDRVQSLDRMSPSAFYDLKDFAFELAGDDVELKERFLSALNDVLVHTAHTQNIYSLGYVDDNYNYDYIEPKEGATSLSLCGINTYIPFAEAPITNSYYLQTEWAAKLYGRE